MTRVRASSAEATAFHDALTQQIVNVWPGNCPPDFARQLRWAVAEATKNWNVLCVRNHFATGPMERMIAQSPWENVKE